MIVHFTTKDKLEKIKESGFLKPKENVFNSTTGGDINKISFFKGFNYRDNALVDYYKMFFAQLKNSNPFVEKPYELNDVVCLVVDSSELQKYFEEYPKQKNELLVAGFNKDYYDNIGIYVKTEYEIPFERVVEII